MRTNIEIEDTLLAQAMKVSGAPTKRATVEEALRLLVRLGDQSKALAELKGMGWEGDLAKLRRAPKPRAA